MPFQINWNVVQRRDHQTAKLAIFKWLVLFTMALPTSLTAATYYVDFLNGLDANNGTSKTTPWQHVKGMVGCTATCNSTTPASGDTVIFKGGVTWTSSFQWGVYGGSSSMVTYTTDHTWYNGASWSQPMFDDSGVDRPSGGAIYILANYVTLNDLHIQNCGAQPGTVSYHECVQIQNVNNIAITNCTFTTNDWIAIYFLFRNDGSYSNFTLTGNDFSHTSNAIWITTYQANATLHNWNISNNTFHDYYDNMVGGTHGNGLHFYTSPHGWQGGYTAYLDGMTFCNNRFYGDFSSYGAPYTGGNVGGGMTAFFFIEDSLSGTICNNDFAFNNPGAGYGTGFNSLILLGEGPATGVTRTIGIYNNSLGNPGSSVMSAGMNLAGFTSGDSVTLKNNIGSGMANCIYAQDAGSASALTSDYNLWNCANGPGAAFKLVSTYYSYSSWQSAGYDTHGVLGLNPLFVSLPGNEQLGAGSPAIWAGVNLSNLGFGALNYDIAGVMRRSPGAWDIGAFQSPNPGPPPQPPSGLKAVPR